jgi:methionyl-tRNA synthetase
MIHSDPSSCHRWYVTTAIPYVNASPHLGFAQETIVTDALARYYRQYGEDVRFLSGTDENSLKNVLAAEQEGIPIRDLVARNAARFYALRDALTLSFDDFIRTSERSDHVAGVHKLWRACVQNGDIYQKAYCGLYCVGCEQFYAEDELVDGLCPDHLTAPTLVEETNYFFRLSRYADRIQQLILTNELQIVPEKRRNEILRFIQRGLTDFSISRTQTRAHGWGIPVPDDPDQVIYVWFDALGNYITALDYANEGPLYQRYWAYNPARTHVIGKGITRFHAIYWPAMLLSAQVPLPRQILVHDYVTVDGRKIGKSLGNTVDPIALAARYGADAVRYYVLRAIPSTADGDFTAARFDALYTVDLANQLGNLVRRVVSMIQRYTGCKVPVPASADEAHEQTLKAMAEVLPSIVHAAVQRFAVHEALADIWTFISATNKYIEEVKPWVLAKEATEQDRLATVLATMAEAVRLISAHCAPFLPTTAAAIAASLGIDWPLEQHAPAVLHWGTTASNATVCEVAVLFPKQARLVEGDIHGVALDT